MDSFTIFPDKTIIEAGIVSKEFLHLGVKTFVEACRYVHQIPYGYNSDRDDLMILFKDEYLLYRKALTDSISVREELSGVDIKTVLHAREEGLALLKANISGTR